MNSVSQQGVVLSAIAVSAARAGERGHTPDLIDVGFDRAVDLASEMHRTRPGQRTRWDRKRLELRTEQLRYEVGR
ncbi:MAG: hypothetical protein GX567_19850 [Clostridia bacterium]|nr:hypothetical protein [Clostridia bacterium]